MNPPAELRGATVDSPLGVVLLVTWNGALVALDWEEHRDRLDRWLTRRFGPLPTVDWVSGRSLAADASLGTVIAAGSAQDPVTAVTRYFAGALDALDVLAIDPGGTPFQQQVWAALRRIPPGRTGSYGALAAAIGAPGAVRAVGAANGANPVSLVLPCHRVLGADGSLTGYAGGLHRKRWLLAHERAGQGQLFAGTIAP